MTIGPGWKRAFRLPRLDRKSVERDLDAELSFHLAMREETLKRLGMSADAARTDALARFGDHDRIRDECLTIDRQYARKVRLMEWLESIVTDVRYALRRLRRSPGFTVTAVVTLALGIGASTAVFSALSPVLLEPLPFPHASRLVTVDDRNEAGIPMPATLGTFAEVRARARVFETIAAADDWQPTISGTGEPERLKGQAVTASYFQVYGIAPVVGREFRGDDEQPGGARVAILSERLVQRRFGGDRAIVGRTIDLDGNPYTVVGIMPGSFANVVAPAAELWTPLRDRVTGDLSGRAWGHHYKIIGRLTATATTESATRELLALGRTPTASFARPPWANLEGGLLVRSMQDDVTAPVKPSLYAIAGAVLLLLAIASVNVMNLLLARGSQRRGELAMRIALGAGPGRIMRQLLTESVVLALLGGGLGLLVGQLGVHGLVAMSPPGLPRADAIRVDLRVFAFAVLLTTLVGLIVGLVPALGAVRGKTTDGLHRTASSRISSRSTARSVLVIAEVALAVVLLVGAGLLYRSVTRLLAAPPGFDASHVVTMQVVESGAGFTSDTARLQFFELALERVRQLPGVVSAGWTSQLPLSGDVDGYGYEAQSVAESKNGAVGSALRYEVTPGYFSAMRIPLRRGRLVDATDRAGAPEAIVINESMAKRLFGDRDPIGQGVRFGPEMGSDRPWGYVVGVVGDVKQYSLAADAPDAFYVASGQWLWVDDVQTLVVRTSGDATAMVPSLKRTVWSIDRNLPIQRVRTMDDFVTAAAGQRRFAMVVIETFAIVAFVLAAIGLYGVVAGGVIERIREIGIRAALGATPAVIVGSVVRRSLALAAGGAVIGVGASLAATRLIRTMLFGVSSVDVVTYAGVLLLMLVTAGVAAWAPARRAAGVDPTMALRAD